MIRAEVSQFEPRWLFLLSTSHSSFLSAMVCIMFEQTICVLRVFPGREKVNGNQKTFPTGLRQEPDNKRSEFNFVRFLNVLLNSDVFSYQNVDKLFTKKPPKGPSLLLLFGKSIAHFQENVDICNFPWFYVIWSNVASIWRETAYLLWIESPSKISWDLTFLSIFHDRQVEEYDEANSNFLRFVRFAKKILFLGII